MKFGSKPITLVGKRGRTIGTRYRYKFVRSALRRSMELPDKVVLLWNLESGRAVALVKKDRKTITVEFT